MEVSDTGVGPNLSPRIPYSYRWRIMQFKLLIADLLTINSKYNVDTTRTVELVKEELTEVLNHINSEIMKNSYNGK